jgi:hypothetical protein
LTIGKPKKGRGVSRFFAAAAGSAVGPHSRQELCGNLGNLQQADKNEHKPIIADSLLKWHDSPEIFVSGFCCVFVIARLPEAPFRLRV